VLEVISTIGGEVIYLYESHVDASVDELNIPGAPITK